MSAPTPEPASTPAPLNANVTQTVCHELAEMQQHWWWFLVLGIGWAILGTIAMACTPFISLVTVALFGIVMVIGGIAQVVSAFWAGKWSGFMLQILVGILYVIVGYILVDKPLEGAAGLTLLIAAFLMVGGLVRIVVSMSERFTGWGWALLNGSVSLLLGLLDLPAMALIRSVCHRTVRGHRNGFQWLVLDHVGDRPEEGSDDRVRAGLTTRPAIS